MKLRELALTCERLASSHGDVEVCVNIPDKGDLPLEKEDILLIGGKSSTQKVKYVVLHRGS